MCSVGDDNFDEESASKYMESTSEINPVEKNCNKCRQANACLVLRSKDFYCKECFLSLTIHKFKVLLGKHKLIRPNDKVLVVLGVGHSSAALLHFIRTGLDLNTPKRLKFIPEFLFIDEYYHLTVEERQHLLKNVENLVKKYDFKVLFGNFAQLLNDSDSLFENSSSASINEDDGQKIDDFLGSNVKKLNKTQRNDYLNILRRNLLIKIAERLSCKFIFTLEISADVASQLLSNISLGRGNQIFLDSSFCYSRYNIKILKPLRLYDEDELRYYCKFNNIESIQIREADYDNDSVHSLMRKFVKDLQINYPATVTTIMKTGDKLGLPKGDKCSLCEGPIENVDVLCSMEATEYSHWISTKKLNETDGNFQRFQGDYCFSCRKLQE